MNVTKVSVIRFQTKDFKSGNQENSSENKPNPVICSELIRLDTPVTPAYLPTRDSKSAIIN